MRYWEFAYFISPVHGGFDINDGTQELLDEELGSWVLRELLEDRHQLLLLLVDVLVDYWVDILYFSVCHGQGPHELY